MPEKIEKIEKEETARGRNMQKELQIGNKTFL